VLAKYASQFPEIKLFTVADLFGGWSSVQKEFFGDGGVFDQIYKLRLFTFFAKTLTETTVPSVNVIFSMLSPPPVDALLFVT
jgi:hypothetical protein